MLTRLSRIYRGKTVFLTGHTGFKGSWLSLWLRHLGAEVVGYALDPPTNPSLFEDLALSGDLRHCHGDVRDGGALQRLLFEAKPDLVFHLAAQPLVRYSYQQPVETFETNVLGTVNLLEAVRQTPGVRGTVVVTSDKCYENREWDFAYRENDAMGGFDPYSSSKGCAELVTAAYRNSFFSGRAIASVRAGNVIGGGDWAGDRIVPDCVRALMRGEPINVRNPDAVRPWQHVLEPLSGYLWLGAKLLEDPGRFAEAWNFGPAHAGCTPVRSIVEKLVEGWGRGEWFCPPCEGQPHEARLLKLDTAKSTGLLGWEPVLELDETIRLVVDWYVAYDRGEDIRALTLRQLEAYEEKAASKGLAWAGGEA